MNSPMASMMYNEDGLVQGGCIVMGAGGTEGLVNGTTAPGLALAVCAASAIITGTKLKMMIG